VAGNEGVINARGESACSPLRYYAVFAVFVRLPSSSDVHAERGERRAARDIRASRHIRLFAILRPGHRLVRLNTPQYRPITRSLFVQGEVRRGVRSAEMQARGEEVCVSVFFFVFTDRPIPGAGTAARLFRYLAPVILPLMFVNRLRLAGYSVRPQMQRTTAGS